jgi:glycosyltransferase involved in cell wall biosynthesis
MRILVITPVYPPYKGGMGAVAAQEVNLIRQAGYTVRVVTPRYTNKPPEPQEDTVHMYPLYAWGNAAILPLYELYKEIMCADVVHLHYPFFGTAFSVGILTKLTKKRLIVSWHMQAQAERSAWVRRALFFMHRICEEPVIKRRAESICISSRDYAAILKLPEQKIIVVPFGVDDRRFVPHRNEEFRIAQGALPETCVFLFVGGMDRAHAFKGVSVLLHAFARLNKEIQASLWLVGDGDLREVYTQLAHELRVTDRVTFLGSVPFTDLPRVYQAADVHVLPSVSGAEAYGLVTCEAGASGIPSIVSALPGVRSLVEHEQTGLYVEPGNVQSLQNALERLATNKEERERFGNAAHKKITTEATLQAEQAALLQAYTKQA